MALASGIGLDKEKEGVGEFLEGGRNDNRLNLLRNEVACSETTAAVAAMGEAGGGGAGMGRMGDREREMGERERSTGSMMASPRISIPRLRNLATLASVPVGKKIRVSVHEVELLIAPIVNVPASVTVVVSTA